MEDAKPVVMSDVSRRRRWEGGWGEKREGGEESQVSSVQNQKKDDGFVEQKGSGGWIYFVTHVSKSQKI